MTAHRDLRLLLYFVEVARAGSIRGGAEKLSVSPAVVSEALQELETLIGVTLIKRSTRSMQLTDMGQSVFNPALEMVSAAGTALQFGRAAAQVPSGTVKITIPGELCLSWLPPKLRTFERAFTNVHVGVVVDDETIDLGRSEFDIAVRANFSLEPWGIGNAIAYLPLECVCSPEASDDSLGLRALLSRIGIIGQPEGRQMTRTITAQEYNGKDKHRSRFKVPCRFHAKDHFVAHRLALEGFGAALLMRPTVADDLTSRRLVRVSNDHSFGYVAIRILMRDRHPTAAARALRESFEENGADQAANVN